MARAAYYVKETRIPEKSNSDCLYWKIDTDGTRISITAAGFNAARRKGATWSQEVTVLGGWMPSPDFGIGPDGITISFSPATSPVQAPEEPGQQDAPGPGQEPQVSVVDITSAYPELDTLPTRDQLIGEALTQPIQPAIRSHRPIRRTPIAAGKQGRK